jgi:Glyoxalase-like domain
MATGVQVTFDAVDAHLLARFWAEALHYEKEDHAAFIAQLLSDGQL